MENRTATGAATLDPLRRSCCAKKILSLEPDFAQSKIWLEDTANRRGHSIDFFPKFHCELNFIEMVWGYVKGILRRTCSFNFAELQARLPQVLDEVPLPFVRRVSRHCFRFISGYRLGITGPALDYAMKKYKSHRSFPPEACAAEIIAEMKGKSKAK